MSSGKRRLKTNSVKTLVKPEKVVAWEPLAAGPILAYHTGCFVGNVLYLHGGIREKDSKEPSNELHTFNLETSEWGIITSPGSPALSHHTCVVLNDRYIVLIGGWDGKVRSSNVHAFDTESFEWWQFRSSGFPEQGGLSSHTATLTSSGEILVIGREGGLHMQRRHGDSYLLTCDLKKCSCIYREYTSSVSSRSGHSVTILGNAAYIIGGRSDSQVERLTGFKCPPQTPPPDSVLVDLKDFVSTVCPLRKIPCGRKNHVAVTGPGFILIHGGETFDGRNRDPVGEMYFVRVKPTVEWLPVSGQSIGRAGHLCCSDGHRVIIHGGFTTKGQVCGDVRELVVKDSNTNIT